jgi:hypothetical protein
VNSQRAPCRALGSARRWAGAGLVGAVLCSSPWAQQVCETRADATSLSSTRFHDNGDGTVTDRESKLMWMQCSGGQQWQAGGCIGTAAAYGFADARRLADQVNRDGGAFFNDWRVPALRELATITDRRCRNPRADHAVFPATPAAPFWSSTPRPGEPAGERVLALSFGPEGIVLARKDERLHVRLVRTGP